MIDEATYHRLVDKLWKGVLDAFEDVDPDLAEAYSAGDVVTITLRGGARIILNTQRSTRQVWLAHAARSRAWHFDYDPASQRWMDDKHQGLELTATLAAAVKDLVDLDLAFPHTIS